MVRRAIKYRMLVQSRLSICNFVGWKSTRHSYVIQEHIPIVSSIPTRHSSARIIHIYACTVVSYFASTSVYIEMYVEHQMTMRVWRCFHFYNTGFNWLKVSITFQSGSHLFKGTETMAQLSSKSKCVYKLGGAT